MELPITILWNVLSLKASNSMLQSQFVSFYDLFDKMHMYLVWLLLCHGCFAVRKIKPSPRDLYSSNHSTETTALSPFFFVITEVLYHIQSIGWVRSVLYSHAPVKGDCSLVLAHPESSQTTLNLAVLNNVQNRTVTAAVRFQTLCFRLQALRPPGRLFASYLQYVYSMARSFTILDKEIWKITNRQENERLSRAFHGYCA